jgi:hypothetical protein
VFYNNSPIHIYSFQVYVFIKMEFEAWPASNPEFASDTLSADGGISIPDSTPSLYSSQDSFLSSSPESSLENASPEPAKRILRRRRSTRNTTARKHRDLDMNSNPPMSPDASSSTTNFSFGPQSPSTIEETQQQQTIMMPNSGFEFSSITDRCDEFMENTRVYHALFGTGVVCANDGTYLAIRFDDARYGMMKLKATFAIPKMVLIPSY